MPKDDDLQVPAPPEAMVATVDAATAELLVPEESALPAVPRVVDAELLVQGFRYLQQRIPGFTQITVHEERSMARAAYLDPEFVEKGLQAAEVWPGATTMLGRDAEDLRRESEAIREWDQVELELRALAEGVAAANLKRKHHLGKAILFIYAALRARLQWVTEEHAYLRPYYEAMQRAYQRKQKRRKPRKAAKSETAQAADPGQTPQE